MPIQYYIALASCLFCIGVVGVLTRRNAIIIFMCIELMLNAVNLLLVAFSKMSFGAHLVLQKLQQEQTRNYLFSLLW